MKLLYVTFEAPSEFSGGGLVVKQSIMSLSRHYKIDYLGPDIPDKEAILSINSIETLQPNSNFILRGMNLLKGITTGYYDSWMQKKEKINWSEYSVVYLEFSRYDFVAKYVKQKNKRLIVRVHNVEHDYYYNIKRSKKNIQSNLRFNFIRKQEPDCLRYADVIVCLTQKDRDRLMKLYPESLLNSRFEIIPVCVKQSIECLEDLVKPVRVVNQEPYFLVTGSFWYGPNADGVIWFIKNVWSRLQQNSLLMQNNYNLVIAGARPNETIKKLVNEYKNVKLVDTPQDIVPYFKEAAVYIAPIFSGAGMKVKVAEAMSYGLPIIGTSHAFMGYDIESETTGFIADNEEQCISAINKYLEKSPNEKAKMKEKIFNKYLENYSMMSSSNSFSGIINSLWQV